MYKTQMLNINNKEFVNELERKLDEEFKNTYLVWDSLFNVDISLVENEIVGLVITICELGETEFFYITPDDVWSCGEKMANDFKQSIIKVLNDMMVEEEQVFEELEEPKEPTAEELFKQIKRNGVLPYVVYYPTEYQVEEYANDPEKLKDLEHSITYTWQTTYSMSWICFDLDEKKWYAGHVDKDMLNVMDIPDMPMEDVLRLTLNTGLMFTEEENQAIFQQLKELGWLK